MTIDTSASPATVARAEAAVAVAADSVTRSKLSRELEHYLFAKLHAIEEELASGVDPIAAYDRWQSYVPDLPGGARLDSPAEAAWAVDQIGNADDDVERVKRHAEALVDRAKKRAKLIRGLLWPALAAWAEANPPAKGKTIRFEQTGRKLQWRKQKHGRFEVIDNGTATRELEHLLGWDSAQEVLNTKVEVSRSKLKAAYQHADAETKGKLEQARGLKYHAPGEKLKVIK